MAGNSTCGCGGCGCPSCQPANTIFECPGVDPGVLTYGRHLLVLDYQFNERRLANIGGVLVNEQLGGGAWQHAFSNRPKIDLEEVIATEGAQFGQIVIQGSDLRIRKLLGPPSALKFLQTDAAGNLFFDDLPPTTVPDPLVLTEATITTLNVTDLNTAGTLTLNNIAEAALSFFLGLNGAGQVVKAATAGIAVAMFFESASSPNAATPNAAVGPGSFFVIGNQLYDSGSSIIAVTNSTTLTVSQAGKYLLVWQATYNRLNGSEAAGAWLVVNGIVVNNGGGRASYPQNTNAYNQSLTGFEARNLAAGDTIRLQQDSGANAAGRTYEVRMIAIRFAGP